MARRVTGIAVLMASLIAGAMIAGAYGQAPHPFDPIARVLQHPRCVNCHPSGNRPLQGDDHHPHLMKITRGADNRGAPAARCSACHRIENSETSNVPGAPGWALAPPSMAWEGLSARELCTVLKDPKRNGNRSLDDLVEHMDKDRLVQWGWSPGGRRTPVPIPHGEFVALLRMWAASRGPCP
jgi:hypothetical protein